MSRRAPFGLLALVLGLAASCAPARDVGPCDVNAAREVVYVAFSEDDPFGQRGSPAFAGQALMIHSCGYGTQCHSPAANGSARHGVPVGLDFDVRIACDERRPMLMACSDGEIRRLRVEQERTYGARDAIWDAVAIGSMPPGERGRGTLEEIANLPYVRANGTTLPGLETDEGRNILRNWLACGAPVVQVAEGAPQTRVPGDWCGAHEVGDCRYGQPRVPIPAEPNWPSIFERLIFPQCGASCHAPGRPEADESALDLSDIDVAYEQMVGRVAEGSFCGTSGLAHIAPGDPANSLLLLKLETSDVCGEPMPLGIDLLTSEVVDPVRQWISEGAPRE